MFKELKVPLLLLAAVFLYAGCGTRSGYSNYEYRNLLMYSQAPAEVTGYWCEGGFMQFQRFENCSGRRDTIVVVRFKNDHLFEFCGGISVGEYEYFKGLNVIRYKGNNFFATTLCNTGNANGNAIRMFYIDRSDCSIHPVEIVKADAAYSKTLSDGMFIWNDELVSCKDDSITSEFYVWKEADTHCCPSGGKVSVVYDIEQVGRREYKLYPKAINFEEGSFELS